ncbi:MAG: cyclic nucleotide-binding domain-containing protein, partial [Thermodesulfobacteriota bacterium]
MSIAVAALIWGALSAVSLPLGAVIGLWARPPRKVTSSMMAFGGGALLFALTIELFAHALHRSHEGRDVRIILATMAGAVAGGLVFELLNQMLNNRGAFLRKASLISKHILKNKRRDVRKMIHSLSRVKILQVLPPEEVARLIPHVRMVSFKTGETVFSQGDHASELYFIVSGSAQVLRQAASGPHLIAELGEGETFGEIALVSDQPRTATVRAKTDLTVYTLNRKEFTQLVRQSPALRDASSRLVTERLQDIQEKEEKARNSEAEA